MTSAYTRPSPCPNNPLLVNLFCAQFPDDITCRPPAFPARGDSLSQHSFFSWKALLLAPLLVPFCVSLLFEASNPGSDPIFGFLFFLALGSVISHGATALLFLPCLYLLSRICALRWKSVCFLGLLLGVAVFGPIAWIMFRSSGPDSGPPEGTFLQYLWRGRTDVMNWIFPIAGLITALAYWTIRQLTLPRSTNIAPSPAPYLSHPST